MTRKVLYYSFQVVKKDSTNPHLMMISSHYLTDNLLSPIGATDIIAIAPADIKDCDYVLVCSAEYALRKGWVKKSVTNELPVRRYPTFDGQKQLLDSWKKGKIPPAYTTEPNPPSKPKLPIQNKFKQSSFKPPVE